MQIAYRNWRIIFSSILVLGVVAMTSTAFARHGEENILTNRIPEPAPYTTAETTTGGGGVGAPPPPPPL